MPVLYWSGTVTIARLGSHADGVFITVSDAGRRVLIEAKDFEGGPMLASSTASLDEWTGSAPLNAESKLKSNTLHFVRNHYSFKPARTLQHHSTLQRSRTAYKNVPRSQHYFALSFHNTTNRGHGNSGAQASDRRESLSDQVGRSISGVVRRGLPESNESHGQQAPSHKVGTRRGWKVATDALLL